jgi:hypothetical protein
MYGPRTGGYVTISNRVTGYAFRTILFWRWVFFSREQKRFIREGTQRKIQVELEISEAVEKYLLPSLPPELRAIEHLRLKPLQLFLAINSVSLMAHSCLIAEPDGIEFGSDGSLIGKKCLITPSDVISEIARHGQLPTDAAVVLLGWMRNAVQIQPRLFSHVVLRKEEERMILELGEPSLQVDLRKRWGGND